MSTKAFYAKVLAARKQALRHSICSVRGCYGYTVR